MASATCEDPDTSLQYQNIKSYFYLLTLSVLGKKSFHGMNEFLIHGWYFVTKFLELSKYVTCIMFSSCMALGKLTSTG